MKPGVSRRHFLSRSAALAALPMLTSTATPVQSRIVDCNAHLGEHPNRRLLPITEDFLRDRNIQEAWVAPFEALLQRDLTAVNARHVARCAGRLKPVGVVHPGLPGWLDDLRRCREEHGLQMLRLYPGYHGYTLSDASLVRLMEEATAAGMRVQIVAQMEDMRTQHPLLQVKPVDFKPLATLLKQVPEARIMILNANAVMAQTVLRGLPDLWIDMAMIEGVGGVENLLQHWPADRLVFGSHAPFFYAESALLKLEESELTEAQLTAIKQGNAQAWGN